MVLTRVILNMRNANARRDIANRYQLHATIKRICEGAAERPLWRLERSAVAEPPAVLIQTSTTPDPELLRAYDDAYALSFESKHNDLVANLRNGDVCYFRVRANPTVTRNGKRHGLVREEEQLAWIERQFSGNEVVLRQAVVSESLREVFRKRTGGRTITLQSVLFDGVIEVTDAERLRALIHQGIGHARAFGFGLITVRRC